MRVSESKPEKIAIMMEPPIGVLLIIAGSQYALAMIVAKRARELASGDGVLCDCDTDKPVSVAAFEVGEKMIMHIPVKSGIK